MLTNDIKKGTTVRLRNGWNAIIEDNKRGNIRLATVLGWVDEMGSIYAHDIQFVKTETGWVKVTLTDAQRKLAKMTNNFFE